MSRRRYLRPAAPGLVTTHATPALVVACPTCSAAVGALCWERIGRQVVGRVHAARVVLYERKAGIRKPLPGSVAITYVCPICRGPHSRALHPDTEVPVTT